MTLLNLFLMKYILPPGIHDTKMKSFIWHHRAQHSLLFEMACVMCDHSLWLTISTFMKYEEDSMKFFADHGVLHDQPPIFPNCNNECAYRSEQYSWCCYRKINTAKKKIKLCNYRVSTRSGTFLQGVKLPAWKVLLFCRAYLEKEFSVIYVSSQLGIA